MSCRASAATCTLENVGDAPSVLGKSRPREVCFFLTCPGAFGGEEAEWFAYK
jgi:hypothetical protein